MGSNHTKMINAIRRMPGLTEDDDGNITVSFQWKRIVTKQALYQSDDPVRLMFEVYNKLESDAVATIHAQMKKLWEIYDGN